jgi:hypothetical protein
MNILIILCREGEVLDPENLLGHIAITDKVQKIREKNTYIDSWLDALIRGLQAIGEKSHCVIDLVDEPDPLVFDLSEGCLSISYGKATVDVGTVESFTAGLRSAAALLLEIVQEDVSASNELMKNIHKFGSYS